jgi:hypothetical protein
MELIASLIRQLQEAQEKGAEPLHLLALVNQLQSELQRMAYAAAPVAGTGKVAVVLPVNPALPLQTGIVQKTPVTPEIDLPSIPEPVPVPEEKVVEVLQVNESDLEAELEEIRQKAEFSRQQEAKQSRLKPGILFDFEDEVTELPTLIHQPRYHPPAKGTREMNEAMEEQSASLNDVLKEDTLEVAGKLSETPIRDLKKAIGINDRFVFINELFRGDEAMYERSIKTINNFSIYPEARYWMERELKIKLGWDDSKPATQEFYSLVRRRFS